MATTANTIVLQFLTGPFPATREQLVERAREQGAGPQAQAVVEHLPPGDYDSPTAVREALGHPV